MKYLPPVLFTMLFVVIGLASALDFHGVATNAARRSLWNRGSGRSLRVLILIQRVIGAVIALVAATFGVLAIFHR